MDIKNIDKLRELDGFIWGEDKENILESIYYEDVDGTELQFKRNIKNIEGNYETINIFEISEKNLDELEFYGLKVVLNEKPKLTREERDFLEIHDIDTYVARDESGLLVIGNTEPIQENDYWEWEENKLYLSESTFNFITWESGKAWSKAELMELEVVE